MPRAYFTNATLTLAIFYYTNDSVFHILNAVSIEDIPAAWLECSVTNQ